jgi:hypothetical protein
MEVIAEADYDDVYQAWEDSWDDEEPYDYDADDHYFSLDDSEDY